MCGVPSGLSDCLDVRGTASGRLAGRSVGHRGQGDAQRVVVLLGDGHLARRVATPGGLRKIPIRRPSSRTRPSMNPPFMPSSNPTALGRRCRARRAVDSCTGSWAAWDLSYTCAAVHCRGGGMADTEHSKCFARKGVRVQVPLPAPRQSADEPIADRGEFHWGSPRFAFQLETPLWSTTRFPYRRVGRHEGGVGRFPRSRQAPRRTGNASNSASTTRRLTTRSAGCRRSAPKRSRRTRTACSSSPTPTAKSSTSWSRGTPGLDPGAPRKPRVNPGGSRTPVRRRSARHRPCAPAARSSNRESRAGSRR